MTSRSIRTFIILCFIICLCLSAGISQAFPDREAATLTVGDEPQQVTISTDGRFAYVTNSADDTVTVLDLFQFKKDGDDFSVGDMPFGVAVNSARTKLYVGNGGDNTVSVVELSTQTETAVIDVGSVPRGIALESDDSTLYVPNFGGSSLSVLDVVQNVVDDTLTLALYPYRVIIDEDHDLIFISINGTNQVLALDREDFTLQASLGVGSDPRGIALTPDGELLLVVNSGSNTVTIFNTDDYGLEASLVCGGNPREVAVTPDGLYAYVTNASGDSVTILDLTNLNVEESGLNVGSNPQGIAVSPDGRYVVVVNANDDTVSVLTDSPFITIASTNPSILGDNSATESTITWSSDMAGTFQIEVGGNGTIGSGSIISTGSVEADKNAEAVVSTDDLTLGEGTYDVFIYVTSSDSGAVGRTSTELILDNTPPTVPSDVSAKTSGDGTLTVQWSASTDEVSGIDTYRIYFGTSSGVYDDPESPLDAGNSTSMVVSGLESGVTYYFVVAAVDKAGNESDRSEETNGIPIFVGGSVTSDGGCFVSTAMETNRMYYWFIPALFFVLLAFSRLFGKYIRKSKGIPIVLLAAGMSLFPVFLSGGQNAFAFDFNTTGISWSIEGGYFIPTGDRIKDAYDEGFIGKFNITWLNYTNFETSAGVGLVHMDGSGLDENGKQVDSVSAELMYVPVDFTVKFRFQESKTQLLIPYLGGGIIGAYYKEKLENRSSDETGWTYGFEGLVGLRFSLSSLAPKDMSSFNRTIGSKDAFLFIEGNYSSINRFGSDDFDLGGIGIMGGLEIKY